MQICLFTPYLWATTFRPVPLKGQLKEADIVVLGQVEGIRSLELDSSQIVTEVSLLADEWTGGELPLNGVIKVYYPGGQVGDQVYHVEGSPEFHIGEHIALMLKSHNERLWVLNLGLGKYSIKKVGENNLLINQIFPSHPGMGQVFEQSFKDFARRIKKQKFTSRIKDKYDRDNEKQILMSKKNRGRTIASDEYQKIRRTSMSDVIWPLSLLIMLGLVFTYMARRNGD